MRSSLFAAAGITAALAFPLGVQAAPNASTLTPTGNATGATNPDNMANPNDAANQNNNESTAAPTPSNNQAPGAAASNNELNSNEHASNVIRSELERAGFTNINVSPTAFVARATDQNGHVVLMTFQPDSFHAVTLPGNPNGTSGNGDSNGTSGNGEQ